MEFIKKNLFAIRIMVAKKGYHKLISALRQGIRKYHLIDRTQKSLLVRDASMRRSYDGKVIHQQA